MGKKAEFKGFKKEVQHDSNILGGYSDVKRATEEIQKICEHVGAKLNRDDLEAIVEKTSFDILRF